MIVLCAHRTQSYADWLHPSQSRTRDVLLVPLVSFGVVAYSVVPGGGTVFALFMLATDDLILLLDPCATTRKLQWRPRSGR